MSSVENARAVLGWVRAQRRDGCQQCQHAEVRMGAQTSSLWCLKGGFITSRLAVCGQYIPVGKAQA